MYVCIYENVYIYVCVCIYVCVYVYIYMCVCVYIYVCVYMYVCVYLCVYIYICVCICVCMCVCVCVCVCVSSVQFSHSIVSDSLHPMNCSTPGLPVHRQLPEFTQTHVHRVGDVIQPSHPLLSPSPPALNLSQHQSLFQ